MIHAVIRVVMLYATMIVITLCTGWAIRHTVRDASSVSLWQTLATVALSVLFASCVIAILGQVRRESLKEDIRRAFYEWDMAYDRLARHFKNNDVGGVRIYLHRCNELNSLLENLIRDLHREPLALSEAMTSIAANTEAIENIVPPPENEAGMKVLPELRLSLASSNAASGDENE